MHFPEKVNTFLRNFRREFPLAAFIYLDTAVHDEHGRY